MTVRDLISLLLSYPEDMIVVDDFGPIKEEYFKVVEEYYNGDSANPNCEILKNVLMII